MEYILNGKVSLDDYIKFNKFHQKHGFSGKFRIIFYPALFVFFVFYIWSDIDGLIELSIFDIIRVFLPLIAALLFLILFYAFAMPIVYKKHYKANKMLQQTQNIIINEQCISITTEAGSANLTKSNIDKIKYDKDAVYIYTALTMAYIIKKRFLENQNDFENMVNFIKLNYGKK